MAGAVSADPTVSESAISSLRGRGPDGLAVLLAAYAPEIAAVRRGDRAPTNWEQLRAALDRVAGQRDAYASGLYWYTDIEAALEASRSSNRPVLSLRMLGRLDEEYSCANSRFFRTALYANPRVAEFLRSNFVLHWSSERPAPKITIDFGDGRTLVRTVTGNSAHYILDARGRVVDVLPGLYGPEAFVRELGPGLTQARSLGDVDAREWRERQRRYLMSEVARASAEWAAALRELKGQGQADEPVATRPRPTNQPPAPTASNAGERAVTKRLAEVPMLVALDLDSDARLRRFDDDVWVSVAALAPNDFLLDTGAISMVRRHVPAHLTALEIDAVIGNFQSAIAVDSVRARFAMRPEILRRLATLLGRSSDAQLGHFESANRIVYSDVFLTPSSDPWLGLYPTGTYTGLEHGGVFERP